jgi:hypothetical protein
MGDREKQSSMDQSEGWISVAVPDDLQTNQADGGEESYDDNSPAEDLLSDEGGDSVDAIPQEEMGTLASEEDLADADLQQDTEITRDNSSNTEALAAKDDGAVSKRPRESSPGVVGFFYFLSILAVGAAAGYAVLHALGGQPQQLMDMKHPSFLVLTATAGGMVILALLGGLIMGNALGKASRRADQAEDRLEKIAQLDLGSEKGWRDEDYNEYPGLATRLYRMKSAYEMLRVRYARAVELESEVQRLEEAITQRARSELTSGFNHPMAAQLADEAARLVKAEAELRDKLETATTRLAGEGEQLCTGVRNACDWNDQIKSRIHGQTALLAGRLTSLPALAAQLGDLQQIATADSEVVSALDELKEKLVTVDKEMNADELTEVATYVRESVEKIAGISFQIAINVARLGQDGVMLLPLTQQLEGMTNDFKTAAAKVDAVSEHGNELVTLVRQVKKDLQTIVGQAAPTSTADLTWDTTQTQVAELLVNLREIAQNLNELPTQFDEQTSNLNELGTTSAALTGARYELCQPSDCETIDLSVPETVPPTEAVIRDEPLVSASSEPPQPDEETGASAGLFAPAGDESQNGLSQQDGEERPIQGQQVVSEQEPDSEALPDSPLSAQPGLSSPEERVYDLAEFGAVALEDDDAAAAAEADRIYELEELGAVALQ